MIAGVLGVLGSARYNVEGGIPVLEVLVNTVFAFVMPNTLFYDRTDLVSFQHRSDDLFQQSLRHGIATDERGVPESFSCPVDQLGTT